MISFFNTPERKNRIVCWLISFLLFQLTLPAKGFNLRKINDAENLSAHRVFSFYQDKQGILWIGTSRGIDRYDGKQVVNYNPPSAQDVFTGSRIDKIDQAADGTMWIQAAHGFYAIDPETAAIASFDHFHRLGGWDKDSRGNLFLIQENAYIYYILKNRQAFGQLSIPDLKAGDVLAFFIDPADVLRIIRRDGRISCFSIRINAEGIPYLQPLAGYKHASSLLFATSGESHALYWVDTAYALYEWNTATGEVLFRGDLKNQLAGKDEITSLVKFHDDYFIGFKTSGLSVLRKTSGKYRLEDLDIPGGVSCLLRDAYQDMLWIGTTGYGVYTYSIDMYSIQSVHLSDFTLKMRQPVSALFVDKENTLWVGSRGDGILRIFDFQADRNPKDYRMARITAGAGALPDNVILSFAASRQGNLWIGSERGLSYFNLKENRLYPVRLDDGKKKIEFISDLYEQDSSLWISTLGMGLVKATVTWRNEQPVLNVVHRFSLKEDDRFANHFQQMYPENDSILWGMNKGEGLFRLHTATLRREHIRFGGNAINETNVMYKDAEGDYLIGTNFGLVKRNAESYQVLNEVNGFPANGVYGILFDSGSDYWLSTNRGLILYNTRTESFRVYDAQDGLSVLEFNEGAAFKNERNQTLFFGGANGFVAIRRNYFDEGQHYMPPLYFKTLTLRDQSYPVEKFLSRRGNDVFLELSHTQNYFSLSFAAIDHLNGNSYTYYYKLEEDGKGWISNGNADVVSFAGLSPGSYRLYVKYVNKVLGKESYGYKMDIRIVPPWYASRGAYGMYGLLVLAAAGGGVWLWAIRRRKERAARLQRREQKRKEEIYESKLQFFTNISHEFCTPLTLIAAPCNRLMEQKNLSDSAKKYAVVIQQNAERLHALIEDLIAFNRIESGYKKPVVTPVDVTALTGKLAASFAAMVEARGIGFEKQIASGLVWNTDKDFMATVFSNLLSNAFKYVGNEKSVKIRVERVEAELCITVSNTGKGIPEKDLPSLFDRYRILQDFERSEHTAVGARHGLGLAISHAMVRLLEGSIRVESRPDEWTHFCVKLPYLAASLSEADGGEGLSFPDCAPEQLLPPAIPSREMEAGKPTLLVVDDEAEIRWLLFDLFQEEYNVRTAAGGAEALEILKDTHPDLIISDVLMRGMDGLAFSREVKSDATTAHIPFILLSARRDRRGQAEGLDAGAEIYITKPFQVDYLKSSVRRLLERKESLKAYFSSPLSAYTLSGGKFAHAEDRRFFNDMQRIIHKNIRNKELSARLVAEKMNMGLRTFYRKLEEMEVGSLTELIADCRLLKAADLLAKTKLTIDEIVFQSGFTNRSSFYRAFSKKYQCTPTAYRKQHLLEG